MKFDDYKCKQIEGIILFVGGIKPHSRLTCSNWLGKVCPSKGLPLKAIAPTMMPDFVLTMLLLFPNSKVA